MKDRLTGAATKQQPIPIIPEPGARRDVADWLIQRIGDAPIADDIAARRELGISRYGTPLSANNGRDALVDAYQEVLDLLVYLAQDDIENKRKIISDLTRDTLDIALRIRGRLW
jgi:hypothetical protein